MVWSIESCKRSLCSRAGSDAHFVDIGVDVFRWSHVSEDAHTGWLTIFDRYDLCGPVISDQACEHYSALVPGDIPTINIPHSSDASPLEAVPKKGCQERRAGKQTILNPGRSSRQR